MHLIERKMNCLRHWPRASGLSPARPPRTRSPVTTKGVEFCPTIYITRVVIIQKIGWIYRVLRPSTRLTNWTVKSKSKCPRVNMVHDLLISIVVATALTTIEDRLPALKSSPDSILLTSLLVAMVTASKITNQKTTCRTLLVRLQGPQNSNLTHLLASVKTVEVIVVRKWLWRWASPHREVLSVKCQLKSC